MRNISLLLLIAMLCGCAGVRQSRETHERLGLLRALMTQEQVKTIVGKPEFVDHRIISGQEIIIWRYRTAPLPMGRMMASIFGVPKTESTTAVYFADGLLTHIGEQDQ